MGKGTRRFDSPGIVSVDADFIHVVIVTDSDASFNALPRSWNHPALHVESFDANPEAKSRAYSATPSK
jgi:hypothetical protein